MEIEYKSLSEIAKIDISGVDKKTKKNEHPVKLCNFVDVYHNWAITSACMDDFMDASAKSDEIKRFSLKKNQIAITKDSEKRDDIGIATYIAEDLENVLLGYHCVLITPDNNIIDSKFLNAYLHSDTALKHFMYNASGSGQRYTLTLDAIENLKVPIFDLKYQHEVGKIFSIIDRKIENNYQINKELLQYMNQLFDYWFIQFNFPDNNSQPYKSSGGEMVWNNQVNMNIPKGWNVDYMDSGLISSIINTGIDDFEDEKIYIATADVEDFKIINNKNKITINNRPSRANMQPIAKSIWFAKMIGSKKIIAVDEYSKELLDNYIFSTGFCGIKCNCDYFYYLLSFILNENFEVIKDHLCAGSTMKAVKNENIKFINFVLPDKEVLIQFNNIVEKMHHKIYQNNVEIDNLKKIRDYLLPLLVSNQVTLKI